MAEYKRKVIVRFIKYHAMNAYGGTGVTAPRSGSEWSTSRSDRFIISTHWLGESV
jgi:hypothetical protein